MKKRSRPWAARVCGLLVLGVSLALLAGGCHSPWVAMTIVNQGPAMQLLEVDYPSASFGVDALAAGSRYQYRFKIRGSGQMSLHFQDASGKNHTEKGPSLQQGQQGSLTVTIDPQGHAHWSSRLH